MEDYSCSMVDLGAVFQLQFSRIVVPVMETNTFSMELVGQ